MENMYLCKTRLCSAPTKFNQVGLSSCVFFVGTFFFFLKQIHTEFFWKGAYILLSDIPCFLKQGLHSGARCCIMEKMTSEDAAGYLKLL